MKGYIQLVSTKGQFKDDALQTWYIDDYSSRQHALASIYDYLDKFFITIGHRSLMEDLNEMQFNVNGDENFKSKITIPLYFINLILREYNLKLSIMENKNEKRQ